MTTHKFAELQQLLSIQAGMNQRYHQRLAQRWSSWNRVVQIAVALLAVLSLSLTIGTLGSSDAVLSLASLAASILSAAAAVALNVLPFGEWGVDHADLFRRWTDLREDVEGLHAEEDAAPAEHLSDRLFELQAKVHRICALEPAPDETLLERCYQAEVRSRTHDPRG